MGTPFQPQLRDTIVFLEDRGERLYAIDRMLTYLKLAGVLHGVRGLVFGQIERVVADRHGVEVFAALHRSSLRGMSALPQHGACHHPVP